MNRINQFLNALDLQNMGKVGNHVCPVMHTHIHVIPRYTGDQPGPRGGIRRIFPDKANHWERVA